jgi:drug/metabolite transporter (DMT)-like permease
LRPQDLARLVALAALWGGSYLFMRYAVPHVGVVLMIEMRVVIAGIALAALIYATGGAIGWREHWRAFAFVGAVGMALPFVLIAQALTAIDASTAAILNALSPLFASIVAATALYGYTIVFTKVKLKGASAMGTSAGTLLMAALALLPFTPADRDLSAVPALAWLAVLGLAIASTTIAYILYYRLIADVGPVKAITVTLLVPIFGMIWGALFLGEPVTPGRIAGCAIILAGCSLILGLVPLPLRRPAS